MRAPDIRNLACRNNKLAIMKIGEFTLLGDEELLRKLTQLQRSMQKTIVRKACKEAAKPIKEQVKTNCLSMLGKARNIFNKKGQLKTMGTRSFATQVQAISKFDAIWRERQTSIKIIKVKRAKPLSEKQRLKSSFATVMAKAVTIWPAWKRRKRTLGARVVFDTKKYGGQLIYYPENSFTDLKTKKTTGRRSFIPAAIEYGHKLVIFGKETSKRVPPVPVWKTAFLQKAGEAIHIGRKEIRRLLEIEIKKKS